MELRTDDDGVVLSVEDDGPGVPMALREAIFERFRRGDDGTTSRFGGTGLGLAIAKDLVERHGGRIEVGDGASGGALFRVKLPFVPEGPETADEAPSRVDRAARHTLDEVARQTIAELRPSREPAVAIRGGDDQALSSSSSRTIPR